jgi:hypothetical protein
MKRRNLDITPPGLRSDWRQTHRLAGSFVNRSACHGIRVGTTRPIRCDDDTGARVTQPQGRCA